MPPQSPPTQPPAARKPISPWTWTALVAVPLILAASFASYFILAAPIPDHLPDATATGQNAGEAEAGNAAAELEIARLRAEARRNALATGAGFVAIAALILALRRQQHAERSTANAEADALRRQEHLERAAAAAEDDALQRRITDARIRAVEQLGSDNAAVRIGGLHHLERIGQQHPELRQIVLDEVCAYLRLPYSPPRLPVMERLPARQFEPIGPPPAKPKFDDADVEREVRLIAQEILQRHLHRDNDTTYWEHTRLNLRNARLDSLRLAGCHLTSADFSGATFTGHADFKGTTFTGVGRFTSAGFTGFTEFTNAIFSDEAHFWSTRFSDFVTFERTTFTRGAYFVKSTFTNFAMFTAASFPSDADFISAVFAFAADFSNARFAKGASLNAIFRSDAVFRSTNFQGRTSFSPERITGTVDFSGATFMEQKLLQTFAISVERDIAQFTHARLHGPLLGPESALLHLLRDERVLLETTSAHELPEGWSLIPDRAEPHWGHLTYTDPDNEPS